MKKIFLIAACAVAIGGCKEVPPTIDFGTAVSVDTTYITTVPTAAPHNVLVEDFSGQSCPACPAAGTNLENEAATYAASPAGGQVYVMTMYADALQPQNFPPNDAKYDLENPAVNTIISNLAIYTGLGELPTVGVDRVAAYADAGGWDGTIASEVASSDSVNLTVQSNFNSTTASVTTTVNITYAANVPYSQRINLAVTEDSIVDIHEEPAGIPPYTSGFDTTYLYLHTFRGFVSSTPYGDSIATPDHMPGRYYRKVYSYSIPAAISSTRVSNNPKPVPQHCHVVAYITNNGTNGVVAQTAETSISGQ